MQNFEYLFEFKGLKVNIDWYCNKQRQFYNDIVRS